MRRRSILLLLTLVATFIASSRLLTNQAVFIEAPDGQTFHLRRNCPEIRKGRTVVSLSRGDLKEGIGPCPVCAGSPTAPSSQKGGIQQFMTDEEFRATGLQKLTPAERASLDAWFNRFTMLALRAGTASREPVSRGSAPTYLVEVSHNDELFIINGEKFEAKTYCFNVDKDDRVRFIDGSANGACASAKFVNLRTGDVCEVWCE